MTSISSVSSSPPASSYTPAQPRAVQPSQPEPVKDTVKLSQSAKIHLLSHHGQNAKQIALTLSVPLTTVDSYLGVTAKAAATPVVAAEPAKDAPAAK
jgi:hypothetical protein